MLQRSLIRASSSAATVTVKSYKGEEHLVVPFVVMVGDSVVRPMGSEGPEFIPSEVLSFAPEIWNGTNVILDHPNGAATACDPNTLERTQFGTAFNSRFKNGALQIDLWLSPSRASAVGPEAVAIVDKCRSGEKVEVSFAPYMVVEQESGISPNGIPYEYRVQAIVGADHIAALPEGTIGACSVSMGCGGPAIMKGLQQMAANKDKDQNLFRRLMASFSSLLRSEAEVGDLDLWVRITEALRSSEVSFQMLEEIFHDSDTTGRVVYSAGDWQSMSLWQRAFTISAEGVITLNADRTEVKKDPATYSPVTAPETPAVEIVVAADVDSNHTNCQCQGSRKELVNMSEKKKGLVSKLMAHGKFKQSVLEGMSEEVLEGLAGAVEETAAAPETTTPAVSATATTTPAAPITRDQALAAIGISEEQLASMQTAAAAYTAQLNAHKSRLVAHLTTAQTKLSKDALEKMDISTLEGFASALQAASGQADYSFSNVGVRPNSNTDKKYTPPDPHGVNKYIYPTEN